MLNKAILMGRLTRDPELRYTQSNLPVVQFTVAVDRKYSGSGSEKQTDFIPVVAWRKTAEFVSQWFTKGAMIIVEGSIQSRNWQDKNGNNRTSIEVIASSVSFGETKKSRQGNSGHAAQPQQNTYADPNINPDDDYGELSDDDGEVPF